MLATDVGCDAMLSGLEEVLVASPEDVCLHKAYASSLIYHRNPARTGLGKFIETQIKLEEPNLTAEQRKKLEGRRKRLLRDFGAAWLGGLADWLIERPGYRFELARGWLDAVVIPEADADFLAALACAPQARLLRRLSIEEHPVDPAALLPLREAGFLPRLEELRVGEVGAGEEPAAVLNRLLAV